MIMAQYAFKSPASLPPVSRNEFGVRAPVPRGRFRRVPLSPKAPATWAHSFGFISKRFQSRALGRSLAAFTLIELLVVIAVISILAALIMPVGKAVNRKKILSKCRAELVQVEIAVENYKTALGHYPPDNNLDPRLNPLYF